MLASVVMQVLVYERFYVILTMALKHYGSKMQACSQELCDMKIFTSEYFFILEK